ncbi:hypothetical protein K745_gp34 [Haloarcula hispanica virus PH1]|uniref:Uncharacterized protein n=1 Tax=Haloarcula hispanica virus PH1 TaxID=1282967 RepID=M4JFE7_9VIRU|nr:hypothetical protein K745_gp34 [Haloarcula hispanica virus PH1]AGC65559.1 hypothetical protein HhPH1_gp34 [Haloarcula hispanica virus PH1]
MMRVPYHTECRCGHHVVAFCPCLMGEGGHWIRCSECDHINYAEERYGADEKVERGNRRPA